MQYRLVKQDGYVRWVVWLWPQEVVCAFGGPFEDFAFDDARVGADAACRVESLGEFGDGAVP